MDQTKFIQVAAGLGGAAVALGAFGAHGLKTHVTAEMLAVFETGVRYQMYHALAMLALAAGSARMWTGKWAALACWAWCVGVTLFSGSLYVLALSGVRWLGAITPFGGVAFIVGWVFAILAARSNSGRENA